jgi:hypothetical protein
MLKPSFVKIVIYVRDWLSTSSLSKKLYPKNIRIHPNSRKLDMLIKFPNIKLLLSNSLKNDRIINRASAASKNGKGKCLLSTGGIGAGTHDPLSLMRPSGQVE